MAKKEVAKAALLGGKQIGKRGLAAVTGPVGLTAFGVFEAGSLLHGATAGRAKEERIELLNDAFAGTLGTEELLQIGEQENLNDALQEILSVQGETAAVSNSLRLFGAATAEEGLLRNQANQIADISRKSQPTMTEMAARVRALVG